MADKAKDVKKDVKQENFFKRFVKKIGKGFRDMRGEVKKVVWPTKSQVINNTIVVVVAMIVIGAFIWGLDAILGLAVTLLANAGA
ncbi:MAG: preprotein translocase subunit SecE [Oscillospiraceae bacterium]|nr:preprotein translocase subunit SecE [Oscillospiraceae bacterium]